MLIINLNIFSQNIEIEYNVTENTNDPILATSTTYNLILNEQKSIYFNRNDSIKQFKYEKLAFDVKKVGELTRINLSDNHFAFVKEDYFLKDYTKDTLIFNEIIINKKFIVGEKINLFNWEIIPNIEREEYENICYENKQMGLFLEKLGLTPDEITSYVINGSEEDINNIINLVKGL